MKTRYEISKKINGEKIHLVINLSTNDIIRQWDKVECTDVTEEELDSFFGQAVALIENKLVRTLDNIIRVFDTKIKDENGKNIFVCWSYNSIYDAYCNILCVDTKEEIVEKYKNLEFSPFAWSASELRKLLSFTKVEHDCQVEFLHSKGHQFFPFWENIDNMIEIAIDSNWTIKVFLEQMESNFNAMMDTN